MPPPPVVNSLDQLSTGYTVFESDQVLTHTQLNSVAEYADDQIRLSRTRLSGVGLACGLRPSLAGDTVRVTGGVGITTDGDLLHLDADTVYDRFVPYDETFPAYPPLYRNGDVNAPMLGGTYELVPVGAQNEIARPLGQFTSVTGMPLSRMTAVLLMESYRQDDDLCSGTDCDNLGARAVNTRKLLLAGPQTVAALRGGATTPAEAYGALPELAADRPVLTASLTTTPAMAAAYRTACNAIHARLADALPRIFSAAGDVVGDVVSEASGAAWTTRLAAYRTAFTNNGAGIQYYYDFLKDVVDAYNEFREALFGDRTWCSPPIASFPKHLLLGDLVVSEPVSAFGSEDNRTGFYPSPVTSRTAGELEHARFLLRRLDGLITHFQVSTASTLEVRVTPSVTEDRPLGERATPFYYAAGGADPLYPRWSYRLAQRGAAAQAYGYNAAASWAAGGSAAANPLAFQIARFNFFRVEGVVGKPVADALDAVQDQIAARNLPFTVRAVLLGADRTRIIPRKKGTTDLHHLHSLIRKDTDERLRDAEDFTTHYSARVLSAADAGDLFAEQEEEARVQVRGTTASKSTELKSHASGARTAVTGSYAQYRVNASALQQGMSATIGAAADLSYQAAPMATTGFLTPLDNLAAGTQTTWLPWLDEIIGWKEQKKDERLFFSRFAQEHPQVEHLGGVPRGGTLVLVHDTAGTVVAEVALPYHLQEEAVIEEEPVLQTPPVKPPVIRTPPVRTVPTPKRTFDREWVFRKPELEVVYEAKNELDAWVRAETEFVRSQVVTLQKDVVDSVSRTYEGMISNQWSTLSTVADRYTITSPTRETAMASTGTKEGTFTASAPTRQRTVTSFDDRMLGVMVEEARVREEKVAVLEEIAAGAPGDENVARQLEQAQTELGRTLEDTARHLVESGAEVTLGNEAYVAVEQMSRGMTKLSGTTAETTARAIDSTVTGAGKTSVEVAVKAAMPRRG